MVIRLKDFLLSLLEVLIGGLFLVITAVTSAQVFCRYVLNFSLTWSHELSVLLLIWAVWLSVPIGIDKGRHLTVTWVADKLTSRRQVSLIWLQWILILSFFLIAGFLTFPVVNAFQGMYLLTLPIPTNLRYVAATVGCLLSVFVLIAKLFGKREAR
jgi:TRAP-type C4-dicarboxylate transport system permease small subunit